MIFKTMDQDLIAKLIDGEKDVLKEASEEEKTLYDCARCPQCLKVGADKVQVAVRLSINSSGQPEIEESPFSPDRPLPMGYARCRECGTEFDPKSGIIIYPHGSMIISPHSGPLQR